MHQLRSTSDGFTLTELAIVLLIVSLLIGGLLMPLSTQRDIRNVAETQSQMNEVRDAWTGYVMAKGYFPCPAPVDLSTAGTEARTGSACSQRVGLVPWATLGVRKLDSWGHYLRYSVTPEFSNNSTKFTLSSSGDITINGRSPSGAEITLASNVPVAIISFGNRAAWAYSEDGTQITDTSVTNTDEDINGHGDGTVFFSRTPAEQTAHGGEFDDLVVWISPYPLFNSMIAARLLPAP